MIPVNASSFGRAGGRLRRYPGGNENASIFATVRGSMPKGRSFPAGLFLRSEPHNETERTAPRPSSPGPCRRRQRHTCCRIFTPPPPEIPAASLRHFAPPLTHGSELVGWYIEQQRERARLVWRDHDPSTVPPGLPELLRQGSAPRCPGRIRVPTPREVRTARAVLRRHAGRVHPLHRTVRSARGSRRSYYSAPSVRQRTRRCSTPCVCSANRSSRISAPRKSVTGRIEQSAIGHFRAEGG